MLTMYVFILCQYAVNDLDGSARDCDVLTVKELERFTFFKCFFLLILENFLFSIFLLMYSANSVKAASNIPPPNSTNMPCISSKDN